VEWTRSFARVDNAFLIALSAEWEKRLAVYGGRSAIMGVRPEATDIVPDGSRGLGGATARVRLDIVEPLGSAAFLSARVCAKAITARVPPRGLPAAVI
jgi:hypothetical protein